MLCGVLKLKAEGGRGEFGWGDRLVMPCLFR